MRVKVCYHVVDFTGLDLDLRDKRGRTALHICASNNDTIGLKRLLSSGAKKDVEDINGNVPHQLTNDPKLVVELGGKVEEKPKFGGPPSFPVIPSNVPGNIIVNPKKINVSIPPQIPRNTVINPLPDKIENKFDYIDQINRERMEKVRLKNIPKKAPVQIEPLKPPVKVLQPVKAPDIDKKLEKKDEKKSTLVLPQDKTYKVQDSHSGSENDDSGSDNERLEIHYFDTSNLNSVKSNLL